jgi:hypothetical protein
MMRGKVQIVVKAFATLHTNNAVANDRWKATSASPSGIYDTGTAKYKIRPTNIGYEERFASIKPLTRKQLLRRTFQL